MTTGDEAQAVIMNMAWCNSEHEQGQRHTWLRWQRTNTQRNDRLRRGRYTDKERARGTYQQRENDERASVGRDALELCVCDCRRGGGNKAEGAKLVCVCDVDQRQNASVEQRTLCVESNRGR